MQCSNQQEYFEVFDRNKEICYGITSKIDKQRIEEKYPKRFVFEKYDLLDLKKLEERTKVTLKLGLFEKIMFVVIIISIFLSFGCLFVI